MSAVTVRAVIRFLRFLAEKDVVPASALPMPFPPRPIDDRISEFLDWLRHHRGIAESTIGTYRYKLERLLPALGADPTVYDASLVRRVILEEAERHPSSIKLMTTPLRSYLKFLVMRGACQPGIEYAVPTIARWRLSTLPRYLPPAAIEKLIASCDLTARAGIRDRAILLLLARLGLRAGDILMMRLGDIDWEAGTLTVCGKGRREIRLPLPQDAGDALLVYLTERRPTVDCDRVFLRSQAPYRPFRDNCGIARVVEMALERAGITDAPSRGAHLLRHSAATAWLRNGATLDAIGAVLRHQSVETTTLYAKVDIPTLQKVAQPWQGELPC
jgi:site-specific recombinase XerD